MSRTYSSMQLYPSESSAKVLIKPQKKSFDIRKTTNTGIGYDRRLAICQHTFCSMVLEKLFVGLQQNLQTPWKIILEAEIPPPPSPIHLKYKTSNPP